MNVLGDAIADEADDAQAKDAQCDDDANNNLLTVG